jgi:hypothetical protein
MKDIIQPDGIFIFPELFTDEDIIEIMKYKSGIKSHIGLSRKVKNLEGSGDVLKIAKPIMKALFTIIPSWITCSVIIKKPHNDVGEQDVILTFTFNSEGTHSVSFL